MNRPLWQLLLIILVIGYVLRRSAVVLGFGLAEGAADGVPTPLMAAYAVQLGVGLLAGLLVAMVHRWAVPAVAALAVLLAVTLVLETALLAQPSAFGLATGVLALAVTVVLWVVLRRGIGKEAAEDAPTSPSRAR